MFFVFFFFNDTATTEIYTLSLHDALPILHAVLRKLAHLSEYGILARLWFGSLLAACDRRARADRKSTRLNSSHVRISYAVFCLKKKKIEARLTTNSKYHKSQTTASATVVV